MTGPENLVALEAILSSLDQTLVRARSGEEALKALLTDEFAVILLDIAMPGMDGFETAAHIKRRERTRDIPIIFLTAIDAARTTPSAATRPARWTTSPSRSTPGCCAPRCRSSSSSTSKNRQLREQAELLRTQFAAAPAGESARN